MWNIYPHGKQSKVMRGVKFETVHDVLIISSDEAVFNNAKTPYEEALKRSGFDTALVYSKSKNTKPRRGRRMKIIWFNPPYCQSIETNVARKVSLLMIVMCPALA